MSSLAFPTEQRREERVGENLAVAVREVGGEVIQDFFQEHGQRIWPVSQPPAREAITENISSSGMMLLSTFPFRKGMTLALALDLQDLGARLHALATVVWAEREHKASLPYRAGLRLLSISQEDANVLWAYLRRQKLAAA